MGSSILDLATLDFDKQGGTVTVVTQDARSGAVLMVAHADREAMERTLATGEMHYRSRTRGLWHKGATSGHRQRVVSLAADCDGDAVLARVEPLGPACHTGARSCFGGGGEAPAEVGALVALDATIAARAAGMAGMAGARGADGVTEVRGAPPERQDTPAPPAPSHPSPATPTNSSPAPRPSYTQRLLGDRSLRLKKLGEEAAELVTACADADPGRAAEEGADLLYHMLVALRAVGVSLADLERVLAGRVRAENR